jgi:hypothetical protein
MATPIRPFGLNGRGEPMHKTITLSKPTFRVFPWLWYDVYEVEYVSVGGSLFTEIRREVLARKVSKDVARVMRAL